MKYEHITLPSSGERITINADGSIEVPDRPIIPFIEGDGIGVDITPVMRRVVDAAVAQAYGERRRIDWMEVYAGEKANRICGTWFPDESLHALREYVVSIKGPLGTLERTRLGAAAQAIAAAPRPRATARERARGGSPATCEAPRTSPGRKARTTSATASRR